MISKVKICNMALGFLGTNKIAALDERTPEAEQCAIYYDEALQAVLREHPWNFAQSRERLVRVEPGEGVARSYRYAYAYPAKCCRIHRLVDKRGRKSRRFQVFSGTTRRIVATDMAEAVADYTQLVEDATFYDAKFVQALARKLACLLVRPLLKGASSLVEESERLYRVELQEAKACDANEGRPFQDANAPWDGGHDLDGSQRHWRDNDGWGWGA